jgi:hypothetical protein
VDPLGGVTQFVDEMFDKGGEVVDLGGEAVDLGQQHRGDLGVVVVELAVERLHQLRPLLAHDAPRQIGQPLGVPLAPDERFHHVPHRHRGDAGRHRCDLDKGILQ